MPKTPKRPRDMMQLAKLVGEIATGEAGKPEETEPLPDEAAVRRGQGTSSEAVTEEAEGDSQDGGNRALVAAEEVNLSS